MELEKKLWYNAASKQNSEGFSIVCLRCEEQAQKFPEEETCRNTAIRPTGMKEKKMAFDFKKEYRDLYLPKTTPAIIDVPEMNFIAVRGEGNPNEEDGAYKTAIGLLYDIAYTLKMSYKTEHQIPGFYQYSIPPLEGFWWQPGAEGFDYSRKEDFHWISVIRLPEFVTQEEFEWAVKEATVKKKTDFTAVEYLSIAEGLSVQCMHIGAYDDEPRTVAAMKQFAESEGYAEDFSDERLHHEIYLGDPRKSDPTRLKTVIRHPIRKV